MNARSMLLLIPLLVPACAGQSQRNFIGTLQPETGYCDPASQAELSIEGSGILFAPSSGTILLRGQKSGENLTAATTLPGADKMPYALSFRGVLSGKTISGTYATPRCRYIVKLQAITG